MWINEHRRCFQRSVDPHNERRLFFSFFSYLLFGSAKQPCSLPRLPFPLRYAINRVLSNVGYRGNVTPISTKRREVVSPRKQRFARERDLACEKDIPRGRGRAPILVASSTARVESSFPLFMNPQGS